MLDHRAALPIGEAATLSAIMSLVIYRLSATDVGAGGRRSCASVRASRDERVIFTRVRPPAWRGTRHRHGHELSAALARGESDADALAEIAARHGMEVTGPVPEGYP